MSCEHGHGNDPSTCSWCLTAAHDWEAKALAREAEALRVERWHATFNAVIGGLYACPDNAVNNGYREDDYHSLAASQADRDHGPLVKP